MAVPARRCPFLLRPPVPLPRGGRRRRPRGCRLPSHRRYRQRGHGTHGSRFARVFNRRGEKGGGRLRAWSLRPISSVPGAGRPRGAAGGSTPAAGRGPARCPPRGAGATLSAPVSRRRSGPGAAGPAATVLVPVTLQPPLCQVRSLGAPHSPPAGLNPPPPRTPKSQNSEASRVAWDERWGPGTPPRPARPGWPVHGRRDESWAWGVRGDNQQPSLVGCEARVGTARRVGMEQWLESQRRRSGVG